MLVKVELARLQAQIIVQGIEVCGRSGSTDAVGLSAQVRLTESGRNLNNHRQSRGESRLGSEWVDIGILEWVLDPKDLEFMPEGLFY